MVLEASRVLAERLSSEKLSTREKIEKAFKLIVCREPETNEVEILNKHFTEEKVIFEKDKKKAEDYLKQGEYKHEAVENTAETASLMQVIHTIYNMDEAITK